MASVIVFAGLCTANDGGRPDCRSMAMTGPLNKDDYEEDTPGMPPPPPPTGILQNASIRKRRNAMGNIVCISAVIVFFLPCRRMFQVVSSCLMVLYIA